MPRPGAEAVHNKQKYAKPAPFSREKLAAMYDFTGQRAVVKGGTGILGGGARLRPERLRRAGRYPRPESGVRQGRGGGMSC